MQLARSAPPRSPKKGTPAPDPAADIDTAWDADERNSLQHVIQTLALIGGVTEIDALRSQLHGRYDTAGVEVGAIRGSKHSECVPAFRRLAEKTHSSILFVTVMTITCQFCRANSQPLLILVEEEASGIPTLQTLLANARNQQLPNIVPSLWKLLNVPDRSII